MNLDHLFRDAGYFLWPNAFNSTLESPGLAFPLSSGFGYAVSTRSQMAPDSIGTVGRLQRFEYKARRTTTYSFSNSLTTDL